MKGECVGVQFDVIPLLIPAVSVAGEQVVGLKDDALLAKGEKVVQILHRYFIREQRTVELRCVEGQVYHRRFLLYILRVSIPLCKFVSLAVVIPNVVELAIIP